MKVKRSLLIGCTLFIVCLIIIIAKSLIEPISNQQQRRTQIVKDNTAQQAMDMIFESLTVIEEDLENGLVKVSVENKSDYDFHNMMFHMEFVNKKGVAYYVETAFVFDGLKAHEQREIEFKIQDLTMIKDLSWFNFCMEGF